MIWTRTRWKAAHRLARIDRYDDHYDSPLLAQYYALRSQHPGLNGCDYLEERRAGHMYRAQTWRRAERTKQEAIASGQGWNRATGYVSKRRWL